MPELLPFVSKSWIPEEILDILWELSPLPGFSLKGSQLLLLEKFKSNVLSELAEMTALSFIVRVCAHPPGKGDGDKPADEYLRGLEFLAVWTLIAKEVAERPFPREIPLALAKQLLDIASDRAGELEEHSVTPEEAEKKWRQRGISWTETLMMKPGWPKKELKA